MSAPRPKFTSEFKQEAVALVRRSGQSANQVAKELGVSQTALRHWLREATRSASSPNGLQAAEELKVLRREVERLRMLVQIRHCHHESDGSYGSPRIHRDLRAQGFPRISRHRVARLMRLYGIRGVCRRRAPWRSRAGSSEVMAENVLQRQFDATQSNQKWAGAISRSSPPGKGGSLWLCCWICIRSGSWAGPWAHGSRPI